MSITDPWAAVETEPSAGAHDYSEGPPVEPVGEAVGTMRLDVKPAVVAVPEGKLTLTFKGTGTFADRWLVAHVANPAEGLTLLKDPQFKELLDLSKRIATYDGAGGTTTAPQGGNTPQRSAPPQGATEAPSWAPPKKFDDYVYKTGVSAKNGKTWHAWMPPSRDDKREPQFFYPPN